ncbi:hypothetical protein BURKHO8Y_10139 [Burkholderia sp. 8Y]|nr:hypothetical protein BURKHO8Y_10139 [Burkholderia sp. 8Y]
MRVQLGNSHAPARAAQIAGGGLTAGVMRVRARFDATGSTDGTHTAYPVASARPQTTKQRTQEKLNGQG